MEIEVGEYVRTENGIDKFLYKTKYDNGVNKYVFEKTEMSNPEYYVLKHSKNIIDLIQDKDFVKIEFYSERYEKRVTRIFEVSRIEEKYITFENMNCSLFMIDGEWSNRDKLLNPVIKSIVTSQQFSSVEYLFEEE